MFRVLKTKNGDSSVFPILFVLIVSFAAMMIILLKQIDGNIISLQKARYTKAVEMAVSTALATVELAPAVNPTDVNNLDTIALGYTLTNKMQVDKNRLLDVFLETLYRNVQAISITNQEQFKRFVPLIAVVQYDTIALTAYCDKTGWKEYPLYYYDNTTHQNVYLTLGDKYYTVNSTDPEAWKTESNRIYNSVFTPNAEGLPNTLNLTESQKNQYLQEAALANLKSFVNAYKLSHNDYEIDISKFDKNGFSGSVKDVTAFCFAEGIPIKTMLSKEPDRSFFTFKFGGASIKRADQ